MKDLALAWKPVIFLSLLGWSPAFAAQPAARQPTAKWTVDFADAQCVAARAYGTAEEPLNLFLKAPAVGDVIQIGVIRKGSHVDAQQVDATIGVDDRPPLKTSLLYHGPKNSQARVYFTNMRLADFEPIRSAKRLTIRSSGLNESFSLSQVEPLMKVMDRCVADLRQVWNVADALAEQSTLPLRARAKANLASFVSDSDYPADAALKGQSGTVRFALLIDEKGSVADCTVIETSGVAVLDAQTCGVMKNRAKFEPASGTDGKPAKDATLARLTWRTD